VFGFARHTHQNKQSRLRSWSKRKGGLSSVKPVPALLIKTAPSHHRLTRTIRCSIHAQQALGALKHLGAVADYDVLRAAPRRWRCRRCCMWWRCVWCDWTHQLPAVSCCCWCVVCCLTTASAAMCQLQHVISHPTSCARIQGCVWAWRC